MTLAFFGSTFYQIPDHGPVRLFGQNHLNIEALSEFTHKMEINFSSIQLNEFEWTEKVEKG